jgi:CO/xanthine dehydrogenase Mo-binding subunit/aerobic-type carbon monoxide dehydrogenase small subunit (CoxS/CutS family)
VTTHTFTVNGDRHEWDGGSEATLLDVLRGRLGLMGTRFGCGLGQCGACFVLLDGNPVASCDTPLWSVDGRRVVTVEGLADGASLHPVQQAVLREQAAQCGYCVSGILVSAAALLEKNPHPDEPAVVAALDRNLCRCGAHGRLIRAILGATDQAACEPRPAEPIPPAPASEPRPAEPRLPVALPKNLAANPRLGHWVGVAPNGTVTVRVGKVELGQGITTALAQLAADELDVDLARVRMRPAATDEGPNEGTTAGSMSIADSGAALRQACAEVRAAFVAHAVATLDLDASTVTVCDGVIRDAAGRRTTTYGDLAAQVDLDRDADGTVTTKRPDELRLTGTSVARLDLPDKVTGRPRFIHDLLLPGQRYGRVVRPPSPAAKLVEVDLAAVRALPGVLAVVRDGRFLGVVAADEPTADRAADALRTAARWDETATLPDEDDLPGFLRAGPVDSFAVVAPDPAESHDVVQHDVVQQVRASYSRPFLAHASMAPSCAAAWCDGDTVRVWSHTQGVYPLRTAIAAALDLSVDRVVVRHVEGAGCYGHNGADDAAFDAVLLARAVPGQPVHLRWSRRDELTWAPFGSAMAIDVEAGVDATGNVVTWTSQVWSQGHTSRPGYAGSPGLLAASHREGAPAPPVAADPPVAAGAGLARNAIPGYGFAHRDIRGHRALHTPLRSSALRSLGAFANVFAIESFMDELALAAGRDPLEYRLAHLTDPRARDVLLAAAELGRLSDGPSSDSVGLGIGYARYKDRGAYCAVVAEVEAVHEVRLRRLAVAVDVGRVVNPDGVRNQIEGGAIQAASWTLAERVRFDRERVTSADWESYPILRFSEVPRVDVQVLSRPDEPSVGAGEAAQGPTAAAIANALAAALSIRVRDLPLSQDRLLAAMD